MASPANKNKKPVKNKPKAKAAVKSKPASKPKAKTAAKTKPVSKPKAKAPAQAATKPRKSSTKELPALLQAMNQQNQGLVKAAYVSMIIAWVFALLPIPILSYVTMGISNTVAIILAIVCLVRGEIKPGVIVLIGSIAGTSIMYLIGWAIVAFLIGSGMTSF